MLRCARSSSSRVLLSSRRSFATAADAAGIRIAAVDNGQPATTVTVIVKAGSRHEPKPGVAHLLKSYAFKNTNDRSALRIARETEHFGGVLEASLGREHLALTASFLKGDEAHFVELLAEVLTKTRFTPHELNESVLPSIASETADATENAAITALDVAHTLAFRNGLGASLFAPPSAHFSSEDARAFASSVFTKENIAVFGTGISESLLSKLVERSFAHVSKGSKVTASSPSQYFGGETRISVSSGHSVFPQPQTLFIGYGTSNPNLAELSTLKAYLSPQPHLKWARKSSSALFEGLPEHVTVEPVLLPYTDAALFGLLVQAPSTKDIQAAGKVVVSALKGATSSGIKSEELKRAVSKAKFDAAADLESREGLVAAAASALVKEGSAFETLEAKFSSIDKVDATALSKAASTLAKSKPIFVAVGDIHTLPYADEVGL